MLFPVEKGNMGISRYLLALILVGVSLEANIFDPMHESYYNYDQGSAYASPPPKYPNHEGSMKFFVDASYIFWKPYQQGLMLCNTNVQNHDKTTAWLRPYTQLQSGFKVGLGANTFRDGWKVQAQYTWYKNNPGMKASTLNDHISFFTPWADVIDSLVARVSSKFTNYFNRFDIALDRTFFIGHYLSLSPWLGIVAAWETQRFDLNFTPKSPTIFEPHQIVKQTMDWWGVGPYFGFDSTYYFSREWGYYFTGGGSINLASHKTIKKEVRTTTPTSVLTNTRTHIHSIEPMMQASTGLRWESQGRNWGLRAQAGWELQLWFNHNTFMQGTGQGARLGYTNLGNYSMQGITLSLEVFL
jgi:hypothetical protein